MLAALSRVGIGHRLPTTRLVGRPLSRTLGRRVCTTAPSPGHDVHGDGLTHLSTGRLGAAIAKFAEAASVGHADANFHLGLAYDGLIGRDAEDEHPVVPDPSAAARCYLRAAEKGHEMAMLNLSLCHKTGLGVDGVDIQKAWHWLSLAAAGKCERAQFNMGVALDPLHPPYGSPGVDMITKDAAKALFFYRKAVENGHGKAKVNLGVALYTGTGCDKDPDAAEALWLEAHEEGVPQAAFCLNNMEKQPGKMEQLLE